MINESNLSLNRSKKMTFWSSLFRRIKLRKRICLRPKWHKRVSRWTIHLNWEGLKGTTSLFCNIVRCIQSPPIQISPLWTQKLLLWTSTHSIRNLANRRLIIEKITIRLTKMKNRESRKKWELINWDKRNSKWLQFKWNSIKSLATALKVTTNC